MFIPEINNEIDRVIERSPEAESSADEDLDTIDPQKDE